MRRSGRKDDRASYKSGHLAPKTSIILLINCFLIINQVFLTLWAFSSSTVFFSVNLCGDKDKVPPLVNIFIQQNTKPNIRSRISRFPPKKLGNQPRIFAENPDFRTDFLRISALFEYRVLCSSLITGFNARKILLLRTMFQKI